VYLLGSLHVDVAQALQRRLVHQVAGDRAGAALLLCEHPPFISVGREGSRTHILCEPDELRSRQWPVRWVNRGGGCLLHAPGQLAIYPIVALDHFQLGVQAYLDRLHEVIVTLLQDFHIQGQTRAGQAGVWVGARQIAAGGIAVRDWVTYHGLALNINPDLALFRRIHAPGNASPSMTSVERERRGPLRPALVRERVVEYFAARFHCGRVSMFFDHPSLSRKAPLDALATRA
jgi:lipoyl(octanoyl) transferase